MSTDALTLARDLFARPEFIVHAWRDPLVERHGWPTPADATLVYLCPILGPSATMILHRLGSYATDTESLWTPHEFATTFGLGHDDHTALATRSVARLVSFDMARIDPKGLAVRIAVGPLPERWIDRLPNYLRTAYRSPTAA